jgi:hypothetical protein
MGCGSSSEGRASGLQTVDDSVHVMLSHDKKMQQKKGETPHGYVPRAPHPLLQPKQAPATATVVVATEDDDDDEQPKGSGGGGGGGATTTTAASEPSSSSS